MIRLQLVGEAIRECRDVVLAETMRLDLIDTHPCDLMAWVEKTVD